MKVMFGVALMCSLAAGGAAAQPENIHFESEDPFAHIDQGSPQQLDPEAKSQTVNAVQGPYDRREKTYSEPLSVVEEPPPLTLPSLGAE